MAKSNGDFRKVPSGIPGLDGLIEGGLPARSLVLVAGGTGTGKTLLSLQFLYNGATKFNEPGVYLSLEQDPKRLIELGKKFGWDFESLIAKKKLLMISPSVYKFDTMKKAITDAINEVGAKRFVLDSYTIVSTFFESNTDLRRSLLLLGRHLQNLDCVSLAISDVREGEAAYSVSGFEEFAADGIISLSLAADLKRNLFTRSLLVRKMRYTDHSLKRVPFKITDKGITVYPGAELFE